MKRGTVGHPEGTIERAAGYSGLHLGQREVDLLAGFEEWLATEARAAGGLGESDGGRVAARHVGDSLVFAAAWAEPPATILDLGTGVGLPGLPLAIALPGSAIRLVDRSGRRCRLARRAVRVLGLTNVEVVESDIGGVNQGAAGVVSRAAMPPGLLLPHLRRLTEPGGKAVVGGSTVARPDEAGFSIIEVPGSVLGSPRWLLVFERPPVRKP